MARLLIVSVLAVFCATSCAGDTCRAMQACCEKSEGVPGVGDACSKLAPKTMKPKTCESVLQTLAYMHEDQKLPLPTECKLETK